MRKSIKKSPHRQFLENDEEKMRVSTILNNEKVVIMLTDGFQILRNCRN